MSETAQEPLRDTANEAGRVGTSHSPKGSPKTSLGGPSGGPATEDAAATAATVASDLAGVAAETSRHLYESAKDQVTGFADQRKDQAAQSISDIADSLRGTAKTFDDRPNIQSFVGSAAAGLDQLSGAIRDRSFAEIYGDLETFARQRPWALGAVSLAAGFVLARFIKSSADELSQGSAALPARRGRTPDHHAIDA